MDELNELSYRIIGAAIKVHQKLGPGMLESVYERALYLELKKCGLKSQCQVPKGLQYDEIKIETAYKIDLDLLVENKVVIEIKAVEKLAPVHFSQTLSYLKLSGLKLALLINFNESILKEGIKRIVNNF